MVRYALEKKRLDAVWVIPCFEHPFDKPLAPFDRRFEMCERAFEALGDRVKVFDLEKGLGGKSYTYRTVTDLQQRYPDKKFYLMVGEDVAQEAKSWHHSEDLQKIVEWLVIPRGPQSPIPNVSATAVRQALQKGKGLKGLLPKKVIEYIEGHQLYKSA